CPGPGDRAPHPRLTQHELLLERDASTFQFACHLPSRGCLGRSWVMQFIYVVGRILLVAIFLGSGARQLLTLSTTAQFIESWMPSLFAPYAEKLSTLLGISTPQLIVIVLAVIQIALALLIIFNFGSRFAAILLALYLAGSTAYRFNFANLNDLLHGA